MEWKKQWKTLLIMVAFFLAVFFIPLGSKRFDNAVFEALHLLQYYARQHVVLCLIPAFFIAGAISIFISKGAVIKYFGPKSKKIVAYSVSAISGSILAVCSCTVLPLFSGIYKGGAGLGPAIAFLYSGPAINVLAIILTARVLGVHLGIARAVGAIIFSVVIGLLMHLIFLKEELKKCEEDFNLPEDNSQRPLWQNALFFANLILILVFVNWGKPSLDAGFWVNIYSFKWYITSILGLTLAFILCKIYKMELWKLGIVIFSVIVSWFIVPGYPVFSFSVAIVGLSFFISRKSGELGDWFESTWCYAKQIFPLLLFGVLIAGFFLGRPGNEGIVPSEWVYWAVGGNSIRSNVLASVAGAFMYFATLTEVPILQGLIGNGMGQGPALALLLAGPALSLPNMLVIRNVIGTKKTFYFVCLVIALSSISGIVFGNFYS